ncbi:hypothetical protein [Edaphobacter albus]|uniref:hypothetical protein n=1 Tax=Edaphobacter sp. 4G125 TaxID=2763071 RepID=UPI001647769B|nr:hypothetical protein [Edaphobacter sp. 4G125]QNI36694.1 hypothetical protein H7846_17415 [Edaphobacter sp. 4G125]
MAHTSPFYVPLLALFCFVAFWCVANFGVSRISGWHTLAKRFTATSEPYGEFRSVGPWFLTVYFRGSWLKYGSIVRLRAAHDALYLSILLPFRIGHPPLCIPWNEISFSETTQFFMRFVVLTLGEQERVSMRISVKAAEKLDLLNRMNVQKAPAGS